MLETVATSSAAPFASNVNSREMAVLGRRYEILAEAGRGAMGQVFKARDRETREIVALKILKPEIASDPAMVERFKSELLFARKITHKNVCRVYEFNRVDGIAFTSMEFVDGESLRSVLKRFGNVTPRKGIDIALQLCSGLKEAHSQGIVHRDLKPENVMIDTHGNVKIMDFGIARSMETLTLSTGGLVGTPAYMAPEQAAGKTVDHRADIYAMGLMLYEMFTGSQVFHAENAVAVALKHISEAPKPPREIEPSISPSLERTILKCLEKNPDQRFQSIAELESDLRPGVSGAATGDTTVASTSGARETGRHGHRGCTFYAICSRGCACVEVEAVGSARQPGRYCGSRGGRQNTHESRIGQHAGDRKKRRRCRNPFAAGLRLDSSRLIFHRKRWTRQE